MATAQETSTHWTTNGDVKIASLIAGSGEPLVLLHGFTAKASEWANQFGAFDRRMVALNLRGHGDSGWVDRSRYSMADHASDAIAVMDSLDIARADLIGHSLGGMIAAYLALHHPDRFRGIVFSDTAPRPQDAGRSAQLVEQIAELKAESSEMVDLGGRVLAREAAIGCADAMLHLDDYVTQLRGKTFPALVLYGAEDSTNVRAGSAALLEALPNAREAVIAGAGHVPQLTHAQDYNKAISAFLADVSKR